MSVIIIGIQLSYFVDCIQLGKVDVLDLTSHFPLWGRGGGGGQLTPD